MCGIFGVVQKQPRFIHPKEYQKILLSLLHFSQSRGKESSGLAFYNGDCIYVLKQDIPGNQLIKINEFIDLQQKMTLQTPTRAVIGHARLVTNGSMENNNNNQPVIKDGLVGIHNGIITNDNELWRKFSKIPRDYEVDTEILLALIKHFFDKGKDLTHATTKVYSLIEGSASIAVFFDKLDYLLLATNTGSLYTYTNSKYFIFASEKYILSQSLSISLSLDNNDLLKINQLAANQGILVNLKNNSIISFALKNPIKTKILTRHAIPITDTSPKLNTLSRNILKLNQEQINEFNHEYIDAKKKIVKLRRCTRCILPETMPYIEFDEEGVCNYCHSYVPIKVKGGAALDKIVSKFRSRTGEADCLLAFSGGRDSCYALHYVVKELKLHPIVYSYDWGMITDLGRRNQARMCGKLGVEQILHSADIKKKRENIRKNILAWLEKPSLGMIPLFMAGDKHYFYYFNKLSRQLKIGNLFYSGNLLEQTYFKYGFAGVKLQFEQKVAYKIGLVREIRLLLYYLKQFVSNPRYLNSTLIDTVTGYISSFFTNKDYLYLFQYIKWDELEVNHVLMKQYNWEVSPDTESTWRIGDGTASFYNYIYYKVTGFTENDTFRSNQIREGLISRERAYELTEIENKPGGTQSNGTAMRLGLTYIRRLQR